MMRGNWFGSGYCPLWGGFNSYSYWHILMMVGFVILIAGVVMIFKNKKTSSNEALEVLKVEFASGNIDEATYLNRKEILNRK